MADERKRVYTLEQTVTERYYYDPEKIADEYGAEFIAFQAEYPHWTFNDFVIHLFELYDGSQFCDTLFYNDANPSVGLHLAVEGEPGNSAYERDPLSGCPGKRMVSPPVASNPPQFSSHARGSNSIPTIANRLPAPPSPEQEGTDATVIHCSHCSREWPPGGQPSSCERPYCGLNSGEPLEVLDEPPEQEQQP